MLIYRQVEEHIEKWEEYCNQLVNGFDHYISTNRSVNKASDQLRFLLRRNNYFEDGNRILVSIALSGLL